MPRKKIEKELGEKILDIIEFVPRYFKTLWSVIVHPKKTFNSLSTENNSKTFLMPEAFLGINILLSTSIGSAIGYSFPSFPFQPQWLKNYLGDLGFITLRYLLGFLVFLFLIKWLIAYRKHDSFIRKVFPILCYGSSLYIFYIVAYMFFGSIIPDGTFDMISNIMLMTPSTTPKFDLGIVVKALLLYMPPLMILLWWIWLIYYGLKSYKINSPRRTKIALFFAILIFFMINYTIQFTEGRFLNASMNNGLDIMMKNDINKEISKGPSCYLKTAFDANIVANNSMMPEAVRYYYLMKKISFMISLPMYNNDKELVTKIMNRLKERKFVEIEQIIYANRKNISSNLNLENELEAAKSLRQSPDYVELHGKKMMLLPKSVSNPIPLSPDVLNIYGENFLLFPFIKPGKIISIFP